LARFAEFSVGVSGHGYEAVARISSWFVTTHTRPTSPPARRKNVPLSPLALKMQADLQLAGLGERTQESYPRSVRKFAQWLKRAPDQASENDLRRYLLFHQERPA
jgi:hypothetical protein